MRQPGYIVTDRGIFEHPLFRRRPDWIRPFLWLVAQAAWKPEGRRGEWGVVHLERGQLPASLRALGKAWRWPKSNVDRFLKRLARENMVKLKSGTTTGTTTGTTIHHVTVVTICNYDRFQGGSGRTKKAGQQAGQQAGQPAQQVLPLSGVFASQTANQLTKERIKAGTGEQRAVEKSGENRLNLRKYKPKHGSKGNGMVWLDYGTQEWELHAADFRGITGAEKMPEIREGGRGNWFVILGEAARRHAAGRH